MNMLYGRLESEIRVEFQVPKKIINYYFHIGNLLFLPKLTSCSCTVPVKMREVVLIQGTNQIESEIQFFCNPLLSDVIVPSTIVLEVKWFVDEVNVVSETFNTQDQTVATLGEEFWTMGQTVIIIWL